MREGSSVTDNPSTAGYEPKANSSVPHSARVWNYWLGGKDNNFAADRQLGDQIRPRDAFAGIVEVARVFRQFLTRAVTYLAGAQGIRQFLDIGTGHGGHTYEMAQRISPGSRVFHVDESASR